MLKSLLLVSLIFFSHSSSLALTENESFLFEAIKQNNVKEVEALLEFGTSSNVVDGQGRSLLFEAAYCGYLEIVRLLLQDPHININVQDNEGYSALYAACATNQTEVVKELLKNPQIKIDIVDGYGNTPLQIAAERGAADITWLLLEKGADVNLASSTGLTSLIRASGEGHVGVVKELLKIKDIQVNAVTNNGWSALSCATAKGFVEIVNELLKRQDININVVFPAVCTAVDVAEATDRKEIKHILEAHGGVALTPIKMTVEEFLVGINAGNIQQMSSQLSPSNTDLEMAMKDLLKSPLTCSIESPKFTILNSEKVRVEGSCSASGVRAARYGSVEWKLWGISVYFMLEKKDGAWLITDTDLPKKIK